MSNLRNPNLRSRDIRKLVNVVSQKIIWDIGVGKKNEWVFASLDGDINKDKFLSWVDSKEIGLTTECIFTDDAFSEPVRVKWKQIRDNMDILFKESNVIAYDLDLRWSLEIATQGVARFGRYQ